MWRRINRNYSLGRREEKMKEKWTKLPGQYQAIGHPRNWNPRKRRRWYWGEKNLRKLWLKMSQVWWKIPIYRDNLTFTPSGAKRKQVHLARHGRAVNTRDRKSWKHQEHKDPWHIWKQHSECVLNGLLAIMGTSVLCKTVQRHLLGVERKKKPSAPISYP